jgi:RHS repeat-associated protein
MPAGGDYLPSAGLEVLTLVGERAGVGADVTLSHFDPFTQHWVQRLPSIPLLDSAFPEFLPPGAALFARADSPAELIVPDATLRIRYYHQDHLGSSSVMTDADGALVEESAFYPFGIPRHEHRVRQVEEAYKFTQKERDRESGLNYFAARYLAGGMSRFLSVDPKYANTDASAGDPQAMNLYAYVVNNPLKYSDPTGLDKYSDIAHAAAVSDTRAAEKSDAASASAGFGDNLLDMFTPNPYIYQGLLGGTRLGPDIRSGLGINNVDMNSGAYDKGDTAGMIFSFAAGGGGVAKSGLNAIKTGITAARTARAASAVEREAAQLLKGRISAISERAPAVNREMDDFLKSLKGEGMTSTDNWVQLGDIPGLPTPIPPKSFIELQDAFFDVSRATGMSDKALTKATGFSPYR